MLSRAVFSNSQFARQLVTIALASTGLALLAPAGASAATSCDRVAGPGGSDSAAGTVDAPYATAQKLVGSLSAGQTGCLRAGTYTQDVTISHGGAANAPIILTSYPGDQRATIVGRMWLQQGADYVTVSDLDLNGVNSANLPSPTVDDAYAVFTGDDVTDHHTAICFALGDYPETWGHAQDTLIQGNRIHDCGKLPAANHDHAIYVDASDYAQILDNVIFNNSDRGVQLYPNAQHTTIERNVIDSNGEGVLFSGDFGLAANNNLVSNNVITNSNVRNNVESWYPSGNPVGQGNLVTNSCIHGGIDDHGSGGIDTSSGGVSVGANTIADPGYADPSAGDYTPSSTSACANVLAGTTAPLRPFPATADGTGTGTTSGGSTGSGGSGGTSTPPTITGTNPAASATDIAPSATVSVSFSETMNQSAAQSAFSLVRSSDGAAVSGKFSWNGNTMTFIPAASLASSTGYTATVSVAATDSSGNPTQSATQWNFTVRASQSVTAAPSSTSVSTGSVSSGGAGSLASADGVYFTVNSSGRRSRNVSWYGTVSGTPSTLQNLTVNVKTKSSGTCNQTVSIYNFSSSSWVALDSRSVGSTPVAFGVAPSGTLSHYVGSGNLRVKVSCSAGSSFAHGTDLLRVSYTNP